MTDKTAQDWSNYWQGRAASEAGAALVGVGVETNQEIGSFDVVASQFGFEYADPIKAAGEAARLLKPDGQFLALAHSRDSAIEAEVSALLKF